MGRPEESNSDQSSTQLLAGQKTWRIMDKMSIKSLHDERSETGRITVISFIVLVVALPLTIYSASVFATGSTRMPGDTDFDLYSYIISGLCFGLGWIVLGAFYTFVMSLVRKSEITSELIELIK